MTAREMEIIDETEIFTEALVASVMLGTLTVDQLKRQLEDGLAYIEARYADNVAEELLVAVAALQRVNEGRQWLLNGDRSADSEFVFSDYASSRRGGLRLREKHSKAA